MTVPSPQNKPAEQCVNMAEVRTGIDHLDRALVKLLAERQRYIERAAEIKGRQSEIRDEARIADVLDKVTVAAAATGLSADIARPVWRELIERSIALEEIEFEKRQRFK